MQTDYPEKYKTLGLKIAYYRKKAGYTQEVLCRKDQQKRQLLGAGRGNRHDTGRIVRNAL